MKKNIILSIIGIMLMLLAGCSEPSGDDGKILVIGTNAEYKPFEYLKDGEIVGFDVDMMSKIAKKIGYKIQWENMSFDGLIPALQMKKVDVVVAAMTPSPERAQNVLFSKNYYTSGSTVLIRNSDKSIIKNPEDLKGKKIGVQLGTVQNLLAGKISNAKVVPYNSPAFAVIDLNKRKLDAVIVDKAVKGPFLKNYTDLTSFPIEYKNSSGFAIVVRQSDAELVKEMNKEIDAIMKSSDYKKLLKKYMID